MSLKKLNTTSKKTKWKKMLHNITEARAKAIEELIQVLRYKAFLQTG